MTDPLTPEDEVTLRRLADVADPERGWFTPSEVRRLLATLDAARADTALLVKAARTFVAAAQSPNGIPAMTDRQWVAFDDLRAALEATES